ncbi:GntR family transcriptional regulator [Streptomyces albidoflavus]|uniref:GntR family transcriptional regulator n=1 Tax=Streptomyces albidoflavus TaxID=1886 RepID=UPI00340ABDEB
MTSSGTLAAVLRAAIDDGQYRPGDRLPTNPALMAEYGVSKATVTKAISELAADGIVVTARRGGTRVRHRTPIRLSVSRYRQVLTPGGSKGPWETATEAAGLDGEMRLIDVSEVRDPEIAQLLESASDVDLVRRYRHAIIRPDDLVQIQYAWYLASDARDTGLDGTDKVVGGIYGALTAAGRPPASATERIGIRPPTEEEAALLQISGRVPVITVERITVDAAGAPVEVVRAVAPADRIEYTYEGLDVRKGA